MALAELYKLTYLLGVYPVCASMHRREHVHYGNSSVSLPRCSYVTSKGKPPGSLWSLGSRGLRMCRRASPMNYVLEAAVICYKPRSGECQVIFEEVGDREVSDWPRFSLGYAALGASEIRR